MARHGKEPNYVDPHPATFFKVPNMKVIRDFRLNAEEYKLLCDLDDVHIAHYGRLKDHFMPIDPQKVYFAPATDLVEPLHKADKRSVYNILARLHEGGLISRRSISSRDGIKIKFLKVGTIETVQLNFTLSMANSSAEDPKCAIRLHTVIREFPHNKITK